MLIPMPPVALGGYSGYAKSRQTTILSLLSLQTVVILYYHYKPGRLADCGKLEAVKARRKFLPSLHPNAYACDSGDDHDDVELLLDQVWARIYAPQEVAGQQFREALSTVEEEPPQLENDSDDDLGFRMCFVFLHTGLAADGVSQPGQVSLKSRLSAEDIANLDPGPPSPNRQLQAAWASLQTIVTLCGVHLFPKVVDLIDFWETAQDCHRVLHSPTA
ncbi:hypothetical protein AK812_SmicGene25726 [Symbiodinium microadriaticum]|uniref:Uncharacterized protein n=1 Tax=Symbiodinium microadriaticum TaxID=2951 RepID=A0A1Q9DB73_SYMMI|nr:hypothetical protein AK812_SmicGene25726 [Symbiodinium microadriaticum]